MIPRWIPIALLLAAVLALVPFACVARSRAVHFGTPRLHLVQDMDDLGSFRAQEANPLFRDGRAMRAPVPGTLARGQLQADDAYWRGSIRGAWTTAFPLPVTRELVERGRERYEIFCAPCHGLAGYGDGMVARRAERRQQGAWVPPSSLHAEPASSRPLGHLFQTITHGIRSMPAYEAQIPVTDRWAIVAYVRALQRSQSALLAELPPDERARLEAEPRPVAAPASGAPPAVTAPSAEAPREEAAPGHPAAPGGEVER